jgi:serpin B
MLTRRDILRALTLLTAGAAAPGALVACSSDDGSGQVRDDPDVKSELDLVSSDVARGAGLPEAIPDVVQAMHRLAGGLYGELSVAPGNLALSPYSIAMALGMTVNGAGGETAQQMLDVLNSMPERGRTGTFIDVDRFNGGLNALDSAIEGLAGKQERADGSTARIALATANCLFPHESTEFNQAFLDLLAREYGAGLRLVDYVGATEQARTLINKWTAGQTHDRIPEIIPADVLDLYTRLVLVNALYLKAPWETPFEKTITAPEPFHLADGTTVQVETMHGMIEMAGHVRSNGWQGVRLPYVGAKLAMTIVLPDEGRQADVESAISAGRLPDMLADIRPQGVQLSLPRWTFRTPSPLKDTLIALGMPLAFTDEADFSGMTTDAKLAIKAVLHEVYIAVDEEGTEAAAATAIVMRDVSAPLVEPVVVDRPFLFVIHDVEHGTPLFLGRVTDPRS